MCAHHLLPVIDIGDVCIRCSIRMINRFKDAVFPDEAMSYQSGFSHIKTYDLPSVINSERHGVACFGTKIDGGINTIFEIESGQSFICIDPVADDSTITTNIDGDRPCAAGRVDIGELAFRQKKTTASGLIYILSDYLSFVINAESRSTSSCFRVIDKIELTFSPEKTSHQNSFTIKPDDFTFVIYLCGR